ncbi:hypothetical protein CLF_110201 [Clonorchis sinensis]|uniref:Uncharacterized protein n=1 Tax=Clonorchis sinensis TaxID=79923 RepID=G7YKE7_CLOSI|nr:hypothetical protein CLF_110201 [Clonorchis sinensis]
MCTTLTGIRVQILTIAKVQTPPRSTKSSTKDSNPTSSHLLLVVFSHSASLRSLRAKQRNQPMAHPL